jgi:hypothetical protein
MWLKIARVTAATASLLVALPFPSATAQQGTRGTLGSYADPYWGKQGAFICRRWCLDDRTPCDPVHFKDADGRCAGEPRTFYGVLNCRIEGETRPECPTY